MNQHRSRESCCFVGAFGRAVTQDPLDLALDKIQFSKRSQFLKARQAFPVTFGGHGNAAEHCTNFQSLACRPTMKGSGKVASSERVACSDRVDDADRQGRSIEQVAIDERARPLSPALQHHGCRTKPAELTDGMRS